jgi:hypothetical protein
MATYFNRSRMGLAVKFARGGSKLVGPKATIEIEQADIGNEIRTLAAKGFLVPTAKLATPTEALDSSPEGDLPVSEASSQVSEEKPAIPIRRKYRRQNVE